MGESAKKVRTVVMLDADLYAGLKARQDRDGVPMAESVRRAVRTYLEAPGLEESMAAARRVGGSASVLHAAQAVEDAQYGWS